MIASLDALNVVFAARQGEHDANAISKAAIEHVRTARFISLPSLSTCVARFALERQLADKRHLLGGSEVVSYLYFVEVDARRLDSPVVIAAVPCDLPWAGSLIPVY
jgi:hypothetical protein